MAVPVAMIVKLAIAAAKAKKKAEEKKRKEAEAREKKKEEEKAKREEQRQAKKQSRAESPKEAKLPPDKAKAKEAQEVYRARQQKPGEPSAVSMQLPGEAGWLKAEEALLKKGKTGQATKLRRKALEEGKVGGGAPTQRRGKRKRKLAAKQALEKTEAGRMAPTPVSRTIPQMEMHRKEEAKRERIKKNSLMAQSITTGDVAIHGAPGDIFRPGPGEFSVMEFPEQFSKGFTYGSPSYKGGRLLFMSPEQREFVDKLLALGEQEREVRQQMITEQQTAQTERMMERQAGQVAREQQQAEQLEKQIKLQEQRRKLLLQQQGLAQ